MADEPRGRDQEDTAGEESHLHSSSLLVARRWSLRPALGIDVGGTTAKLGLVNSEGRIQERATVATGFAITADDLVSSLAEAARTLVERAGAQGVQVSTAGLALPGMLLPDGSGVRNVTNMPGLNDAPLREQLAERLGLRVAVDNDACAAAQGEYLYGAGRGVARLLVVTVGTGIGAGMVVEGAVFRTSQGCLGDPGHVIVALDGPRCGCGGHGCLEVLAAAPAIVRDAAREAAEQPASALAGLRQPLEVREIARAAAAGDAAARQVLSNAGRWIGMGLATLVHILSPERILIGGGVADAGELLLEPIRASLFAHAMPFLTRELTLDRAALTTDAGILGAAAVGLLG